MRNVQKSPVSEYFDLFLSSAAARGVKDKTLSTYKQHFHSISKRLDVTLPLNRLPTFWKPIVRRDLPLRILRICLICWAGMWMPTQAQTADSKP